MNNNKNSRRDFVKTVSLATAGIITGACYSPLKATNTGGNGQRYKIAVCDWMILKRQKLGAFSLASEINAEGIELDMGGLGSRETFDSKLGDPAVRNEFLETSRKLGVEISSIAMSGFYAQSFAERPTVDRMIQDTLNTMQAMNVRVAFLPLGVQGDMVKRPELRPKIVKRLQEAGKKAGEIGAVIAVETSFDAKEERRFLKEVGSPYVKSSFNFANAVEHGRDISKELRTLGKEYIAQIHCSNTDGVWLENDKQIDMPAVKKTLDRMKWEGWLIVERSRDVNMVRNVKANYGANVAYLKSVFQE